MHAQIADITFNVWYRLSEELLKQNEGQLCELFKPYIERLISHLCSHCQLDEDTSPVSKMLSYLGHLTVCALCRPK